MSNITDRGMMHKLRGISLTLHKMNDKLDILVEVLEATNKEKDPKKVDKIVKEAGRSDMNYTYPQFIKEHYGNDFHTE